MTDQEIIQGLIDRDDSITSDFFFRRCRPLIFTLIARFYPAGADYDELVNELSCFPHFSSLLIKIRPTVL